MNCFRYKLHHDFGLAPNPFGGIMTLAVCKGSIRKNKNLQVGDWIVGTGSVAMGLVNHLIYAMRVDGKMSIDEYWNHPSFAYKKPVMNGSLVQLYGDNFYHSDPISGRVIQEASAHSNPDNSQNSFQTSRDTAGKYVLYSSHFYYFGDNSPLIPCELQYICYKGRNYSYKGLTGVQIQNFLNWLESNFELGIHGDPCDWKRYKLKPLDL